MAYSNKAFSTRWMGLLAALGMTALVACSAGTASPHDPTPDDLTCAPTSLVCCSGDVGLVPGCSNKQQTCSAGYSLQASSACVAPHDPDAVCRGWGGKPAGPSDSCSDPGYGLACHRNGSGGMGAYPDHCCFPPIVADCNYSADAGHD